MSMTVILGNWLIWPDVGSSDDKPIMIDSVCVCVCVHCDDSALSSGTVM